MKTNIESISSVLKKVVVEVSGEEMSNLRQNILNKLRASANVPGFRKGKVPLSVLEKMYADGLNDELKSAVINESIRYIEESDKLKIVALLKAEASLENGEVSLEIEVVPEIGMPDCSYLTFDNEEVVASDEEIDAALKADIKSEADYKVVEDVANEGDYVKLSYAGHCGDLLIDKLEGLPRLWGKQNATWEEAGEKNVDGIPAVVKAIVGMKAGDKTSVKFTIPNDFPVIEIAGKEATYDIEVFEVRKCILPELTEEFFKRRAVSSLDELKEAFRKKIIEQKTIKREDKNKSKIIDCLIGQLKCEIPSALIKSESEQILQEMVNVFSARGVSESLINEQKQAVISRAKEIATEKIKLNLCIEKIAKEDDIRLENKDFEPALMQLAMRKNMNINKLLTTIKKDEHMRKEVFQHALQIKVVDILYSKIKDNATNAA